MNPTTLIGPSSPMGFPAPYWFLVFFKVLGFVLHVGPMNVWYAGIIIAMLARWRGGEHAQRWSARLMNQMPVIIALGINFGVVPLLFLQVAYYKVFYPATILMAWPWLSIIGLLVVAYFGVYIYAIGLRKNATRLPAWRQAAGWLSAILFIVIGFMFANGFSLMTNVHAWPGILHDTGVAGAPTGTALNTGDPTLWPRWLMMFGLAITTTAAYIVIDAGLLAVRESDDYKRWAMRFAVKLYTVGFIWFAITGSWYVFGTWQPDVRHLMFSHPLVILTVLTAIVPGLPWLLIVGQARGGSVTGRWALLVGFAQVGVLALNGVSRQVVQNAELSRFLDVTAEPVKTQWSPLILFLILFVVGVVIIAWMLGKIITSARPAANSGN